MNRSRKPSKKKAAYGLEVLESRRLLSTVSWTAPTSGAWTTASNWSTDALPQPGDDVVINQPGNVQVTLAGGASVHSLAITGDTLNISGGTLSVAGNANIGSGATLTLPNGTIGPGVGANLLANAGFESPSAGTSTTTPPDGWGQWNDAYVSTQYAQGGTQSLSEDGSSGVYQSFSVSPGFTYNASAYALTPASDPLTESQGAFLQVVFDDASGATIGSPQAWVTLLDADSQTNTWIKSSTTITAPSNAATVILYVQCGPYTSLGDGTGGGLAYIDNVQLDPPVLSTSAVTAASVSNSGTLSIGAGDSVTSTGSFTQTTGATLITQLGDPPASNFFGSLTIGGAAQLAGTFKASLTNSYTPSLSDSFAIVNYATETGSFATYQLPSSSSYQFATGTNPTYFGISAVPPTLTTTVNATTTVASATSNLVGVNLAYWDNQLTTTQTQQMVEAAGLSLFRFPGGSSSDDFHFNVANNHGDSAANTIPQFAQFITRVGGTGIVTTDYGSGSPQEAEAELAYLEGSTTDTTSIGTGIEWNDAAVAWQNVNWQTVGYWAGLRAAAPLATNDGLNFLRISQPAPFSNINYWEIGNEEYGVSWEVDHHGTAGPGGVSTGASHDPATYAKFTAAFAGFVAADPAFPAIHIGIDSGDPTGASDGNWTKNVVTDLYADGYAPGFISDHSYMYGPGSENDSFLLNETVSDPASIDDWSTRYADYESMLQSILGSNAAGVKLMATEFNSNYGTEGKQMTSLVNGIFIADSIGSLLNAGYTGGLVWDLRNGWNTTGNNSPSLYGWREGGDEGILGSSGTNSPPATGPYVPYPSYFAEQLASKIMQTGGTAVATTGNYNELTVYSVLEPNGHLDLMVLNKNPDAALTGQFNLSGFIPTGQAQVWQYGEAQDYAQSQSSTGAAALSNSNATLNLTNNKFSYTFPAYSMTVLDLTNLTSLTVSSGTTTIPAGSGSTINTQIFSAVSIAAGASLVLANSPSQSGRTLLDAQYFTIAGSPGHWSGSLDMNNNDLEVQNASLTTINSQVAQGYNTGSGGIFSSAAMASPRHLTTLGVILNNGLYGSGNLFDGIAPPSAAVLVKYTYYGDTNLDGKVDGSDYSRTDNGCLNHLTGWFNGDFNYDGVVNGSDYTLIDNAFNAQGAALTATVAASIAVTPEKSHGMFVSPTIFQIQSPITFPPPAELSNQKSDVIDALSMAG